MRGKRIAIPVAIIAAFGCAPDRQMPGPQVADASSSSGVPSTGQVGASKAGSFLAGNHARTLNDFSSAAEFLARALAADPENRRLRRQTFHASLVAGRIGEAVELAPAAGQTLLARLTLIVEAVRKKDFPQAEKMLGELPERGIGTIVKPLFLAWVKAETSPDSVLEVLAPIKERRGFHALFDIHAAHIFEMKGRTNAALEHYEKARKSLENLPLRLVQGLGRHYERTGRSAEAQALYEDYLEEEPDTDVLQSALQRLRSGERPAPLITDTSGGVSEALFDIAGRMARRETAQFALACGRLSIHLRPGFDSARLLVAGILESMERHEEAIKIYRQIAEDSLLAWSARLSVARNLERLERDDDAVALLGELSRKAPARRAAFVALGDLYRANEQYEEAIEAYDRALDAVGVIGRNHWTLLYSRGIALERAKRWDRAEKDFEHALRLNPDQPYVLNYLGYSWVDQGINLQRARKMIERAVEQRPDDGYIVDSLGWVLYRFEDFENAVLHLERAVELRPQDPTINDHLGDAYWRVGRRHEARFQWKRALTLDPEPDTVSAIEDKVLHGLEDEPPKNEKDS